MPAHIASPVHFLSAKVFSLECFLQAWELTQIVCAPIGVLDLKKAYSGSIRQICHVKGCSELLNYLMNHQAVSSAGSVC